MKVSQGKTNIKAVVPRLVAAQDTDEYHRLLDNRTVDDTTRQFGVGCCSARSYKQALYDLIISGVAWRDEFEAFGLPWDRNQDDSEQSHLVAHNNTLPDHCCSFMKTKTCDAHHSSLATSHDQYIANGAIVGTKPISSKRPYASDAASAASGTQRRYPPFGTRMDVKRRCQQLDASCCLALLWHQLEKQSRKYLQKANKDF
ncbi:hypothetical protein GUITHDRAFT_137897 [Guillardia theta CCMP2712]|uniref:Uncharacterized protein n=1 Tax=Guillardia theta (strain CCMP2712) TaxID=905079 RepID=L1JF39_GUITC|nr:hypothetical protein GUITHDRAFT_137897 [Guillardia theta CCMP2712]EKX46912.1 hypothetical protein GUITHDRAFT_137897 [Guillardia theta CCMP2712]|eukprot:XP_005833892.1 hypothetical protein GUITHDRAFT_137897 [Guillardia theta CCMP2712]